MKISGYAYNTCIRSVPMHAIEPWVVEVDEIYQLVKNDNAMVRQFCLDKLCGKIPMSDLETCMGISGIKDVIRYNRIYLFDHLQRMDEEKWPRKILNFKVNGTCPRGHPKKRWFDNIRSDLDKMRLSISLALECVKCNQTIQTCRRVLPWL